jgi:Rad52/22 family double-strand break repair protein
MHTQGFTERQVTLLNAETPKHLLKRRTIPGGAQKDYIPATVVIDLANSIFGYGNWSHRYPIVQLVHMGTGEKRDPRNSNARVPVLRITFTVSCETSVKNAYGEWIIRSGIGTATAECDPTANVNEAIKQAQTQAEGLALRRALASHGPVFGLYLKGDFPIDKMPTRMEHTLPAAPATTMPAASVQTLPANPAASLTTGTIQSNAASATAASAHHVPPAPPSPARAAETAPVTPAPPAPPAPPATSKPTPASIAPNTEPAAPAATLPTLPGANEPPDQIQEKVRAAILATRSNEQLRQLGQACEPIIKALAPEVRQRLHALAGEQAQSIAFFVSFKSQVSAAKNHKALTATRMIHSAQITALEKANRTMHDELADFYRVALQALPESVAA